MFTLPAQCESSGRLTIGEFTLQENDFTVPAMGEKGDAILFAQSPEDVEQDLPGAVGKRRGELRKHQPWSYTLEGTDPVLNHLFRRECVKGLRHGSSRCAAEICKTLTQAHKAYVAIQEQVSVLVSSLRRLRFRSLKFSFFSWPNESSIVVFNVLETHSHGAACADPLR